MSRRALLPLLAVLVLFSLPLLPEILGARRLVFRDAQVTHWPWRRVAVESLRAGEVPFVNATASGGQPLLANPNAVLLYPTFLLELVVPSSVAFNLHFLLHVFWAFFGARVLARRIGLSDGAAFLSGIAFAFSGAMLSYGSAFTNSIAAAAWLPWCAAAFLDLARADDAGSAVRSSAALGLAWGLQLLGGEPALSMLTVAFSGAVALAEALAAPPGRRGPRVARSAIGGAAAGVLALALAAPLLLPLRQVFPLTYRGQHLYSEKAFGASAFRPARALEWLFPRFGGDPGALGGGANWLRGESEEIVYLWSVTLGIVPLAVVLLGALRRELWDRRARLYAAGAALTLLFSVGLALPFYRFLFAVGFLRRLRYPIKFYLLTTLCVALLAGLASEVLARRRLGRRGAVAAAGLLLVLTAGWAAAAPGGPLDRWAGPLAVRVSDRPEVFLDAFRGLLRGDALLGALAVLLGALIVRAGDRLREPAHLLGLLTLLTAFVWGLPLFVSAASKDLDRPPALAARLSGPGRLYVSPALPRFDARALAPDDALPRFSRVARILVEELVPATAAPFGVRYLLEPDPDGSYGFYNRLIGEAATAADPLERDRLLRLFGARWALAEEHEAHPLFHPVTGLEIAGRRLVLYENPSPVPELRWAGRTHRRRSLSGSIALVGSDAFDPAHDVVVPGRADEDAAQPPAAALLRPERVVADAAAAAVDAEAPGHVVFSRTFFPAWRAWVDGAAVRPVVGNARDVAVPVAAGRHRIEIAWDRRPFRAGVAIQAAAVLVALGALLRSCQAVVRASRRSRGARGAPDRCPAGTR